MKQNTTEGKNGRHRHGGGQPEIENPANLNRFGNDQRIKYPDNQPHEAATKTP
ncbi:hypothetical protein A2U01_0116409, partial [Trifolium medium]|nr:hypothetical protein [Trifolium medium]